MTRSDGRPLDAGVLDQLFFDARSHNAWQPRPVDDGTIHALYELLRWGPTAANSTPARFLFIRSAEAKERLRPHLSPGNVDKTMTAPCCVVVARDTLFYDLMPQLFPSRDMRASFVANPAVAEETAQRSSTLQGAYLIMAARALGLDAAPMSGFNATTLDAAFFADGRLKSNFLCNIGYGEDTQLFPRNPRLAFDQACEIL